MSCLDKLRGFHSTLCILFSFIIYRYNSPQHIMEEFFTLRMDYYHRRKAALMEKMQNEWRKLDNKVWVRESSVPKNSLDLSVHFCTRCKLNVFK